MRKAGGIIGLIAGIFGVIAAGVTLLFGGIGSAVGSEGASTVVGLGWGGVGFSFLCIVLGAVAMNSTSRVAPALLSLSAIAGAILGGTLVAIFMVLAFTGGLLGVIAKNKSEAAVVDPV